MNIRDDLVRRGVNRVARLIGKQSPMRLELTSMPFVGICSTIELPVHIMDEETQLPHGRAGCEFSSHSLLPTYEFFNST